MMPGMTGLEVLRAVRADPAVATVRVIMYSAVDDAAVVAEAARLGADRWVVKGAGTVNELLAAVASAVGGAGPSA